MITYLRRREQLGCMIPVGTVNTRKTTKPRRRSFSHVVAPGQEREVAEYFAFVYADYPDVLTTDDIAAMTGLHRKSFWRIFRDGHIKYLMCGRKYFIPKVYFLEFITSQRFIDTWSNSEVFIKVLEGFEAWKQNR